MWDNGANLIDLILAWNWIYDIGFIRNLDRICYERGISFLAVSPENLNKTLNHFSQYPFSGGVFLDRASESDERFLPLQDWAQRRSTTCLNRRDHALHAGDKAAVHYDLIRAGIHTPYTTVTPPYRDVQEIGSIDLSPLTKPFVAKPSHGGGSEGVALQVWTYEQIQNARQQYADDAFLLQSTVTPESVDGVRAWFRLIYCLGHVFINWWDTSSHIYTPVSKHPITSQLENGLTSISQTIASSLSMDIFSSEVALTSDGTLVVVDYLNDPIDLRLQSEAVDGVPDETVKRIAELICAKA